MDTVIHSQKAIFSSELLPDHVFEQENNENKDQRVIDMLHESMGHVYPQNINRNHILPGKKQIGNYGQ